MTHPIPEPRRSAELVHRSPRRPLSPSGPFCAACGHRTCRSLRALRLPLIGGHRCEFAKEHLRAAAVQARHPHFVIWFGESSQAYWIATAEGLSEARSVDELLFLVTPARS
ncbi:hypothetical protein DSY14_03600 [Nocardiopsis sp. MG754419]|nr:hypothetical protein [Nocardiopsis sp. MG754419]